MARRRRTNKVDIDALADLYERCAGIDVHKAEVTVCVIRPGTDGSAQGETASYGTTTGELRQLSQWLQECCVTDVAMESTGVYWRPVWQILEAGGFHLWLANAKQVRNMPGRKTDQADAVWLATLLRKGLIKGSFIPPPEIRALRDLCRSRASLVRDRTRVVQRIEKVLEEANIKLDSVASDLMGVGSRMMLEKLIKGETDTTKIAELALGRMRPKIPQLVEALEGYFRPHQTFLLKQLLNQFDDLCRRIERFEQRIEEYARPFDKQMARLDAVPGIDRLSAAAILSETGVEMEPFPTPEQFCRWATIAPGNNKSAGKQRTGKIGKGNRWLRGSLTQCAWAATHDKKSYFAAQYRRLLHRGKQRALVAVAHSMLAAIWHMLTRDVEYHELGADYFEKQNLEGLKKNYLKKLERLGFKVSLEPIAV
jgi:transposase